MRNVNWKDVGETAGRICKFVVASLTLATVYKVTEHINIDLNGLTATYDGAVKAIMDNNRLFSSDKRTAVAALKRNESAEYYRAIIQAVNSDMFNSDKIKMISELSES